MRARKDGRVAELEGEVSSLQIKSTKVVPSCFDPMKYIQSEASCTIQGYLTHKK